MPSCSSGCSTGACSRCSPSAETITRSLGAESAFLGALFLSKLIGLTRQTRDNHTETLSRELRKQGVFRSYVAEQGNDTDVFEAFGPLFRALRGRRWVFTPHAVKVTSGAAAANVYETPEGIALCVSLAAPGSVVHIQVRGVKATGSQLIAPGGNDGTTASVVATQGAIAVEVEITMGRHGAAVVVLTPAVSADVGE
jgi:hypothetical protein